MTNEDRVKIVKEGVCFGYYIKVDGYTESWRMTLIGAKMMKRKLVSILNKNGDLDRVVG